MVVNGNVGGGDGSTDDGAGSDSKGGVRGSMRRNHRAL